ncbi:precorrin-3B C(17)-methyltransferase [Hathewaya histolytica]|uniref:Precorrin-3B C17-methyltransferase n=1 Tax=Hathewaya histolytica TaxID=1498 RepID=A0A4U9R6U6_HATHI|nr:precorrin-3B C(17)-methyltransferase [Hathewaya histolytica]VTQ86351.1 precorrin-3B C17-methyltransferase [Hathewaya histolytica]
MKKLYVIGIGPGGLDHLTIKAKKAIEESDVIVGYTKYIQMIKPLLDGKEVFSTGMKGEEERCKKAIEFAEDKIVSVVSTGDAGIYGMAGLILQLKNDAAIEIVPGVTASSAAASVLGAPLMHDNCNISLSDLMTPYELIKKRVENAAEADFIISLYNPKSKGRPHYLAECLDLVRKYRKGNTPIGVVRHALREGQEVHLFTLDNFDPEVVDMFSMVVIGNSQSYMENERIITPRGYKVEK